jgi:hypothetical protein
MNDKVIVCYKIYTFIFQGPLFLSLLLPVLLALPAYIKYNFRLPVSYNYNYIH